MTRIVIVIVTGCGVSLLIFIRRTIHFASAWNCNCVACINYDLHISYQVIFYFF